MATDALGQTVRRETEIVIGRLVMQNTTLTAQVNALAAELQATKKELADAKQALADAGGDGS